ncbi:MAG: hypothetical protein IKS19_07960 [Clostridia bacterium]|nr:hypothetical protein [Clostridia bacterium]
MKKRIVALLFAVVLVLCLTFSAFATNVSPQNPDNPNPPSPPTGSIIVVALAVAAAAGTGVFAIANKKAKK